MRAVYESAPALCYKYGLMVRTRAQRERGQRRGEQHPEVQRLALQRGPQPAAVL